ncbi:hypothetical protein [Halomonas elongata]|uniref:Uncharacterized protein n=1 Tax=Halomonas elongata (strain ATCC 33173 / DSM 2581 / NBRC 15536 / NCIMB 2198 / 1H9) TaxID=768066 RepID=E1VA26_HALED|nr:hypothetical protein [Halomonas elongata]WBF17652.1 hypothetical protein LM502_16485 [Halomonas elongata]WPU46491.1 hypothetical protein SR933_14715 [Halomonas elongata DSM 2581]CBV43914.1 uncharacterized protein HELO_4030 [Halomonas elongata DSM 2581]
MGDIVDFPITRTHGCQECYLGLDQEVAQADLQLLCPMQHLMRGALAHSDLAPWHDLLADTALLLRAACGRLESAAESRRLAELEMQALTDLDALTVVLDNLYCLHRQWPVNREDAVRRPLRELTLNLERLLSAGAEAELD